MYRLKVIKYLMEIIYHYSSKISIWSWQKLYADRNKGYGYKKKQHKGR